MKFKKKINIWTKSNVKQKNRNQKKKKKNQIEILELKNMMNEMKKMQERASVSDWIKQKKKSVKQKVGHFKLSSQRSSKEWQGMKKAYVSYEIPLGETTIYYWSPRGRREQKAYLKK